jgi:hypothetical protein
MKRSFKAFRPTVRVPLFSGLGNQMFMYAAGRALAIRLGATLELDVCRFPRDRVYRRVYLLDRFPIEGKTVSNGICERFGSLAERTARRLGGHVYPLGSTLLVEPSAAGKPIFDERLLEPPHARHIVLDGYWQSERYFADHASVIRAELQPPRPLAEQSLRDLASIERAACPVAVGIRSYREVPGRPVNRESLLAPYRAALGEVSLRLPSATYFVFTDAPELVSDPDSLGVPFTLVHGSVRDDDAPVDMHLMSRCHSFLIGYSSYHWWSAWLGSAPGKRVFFIPGFGSHSLSYVPPTWTVIGAASPRSVVAP